jgi:Protein of unknown function (DUF1295)
MLRTIILLILTLIALPIIAFKYDSPLNEAQWAALQSSFYLMLGVALTCFVVSELTKNYSQVDKIWSIVPMAYAWFFAQQSAWNQRMVIMAVLVSIWALRLTFNFARRGGYHWIPWKGEEDYRWGVLRQNPLFQKRINWVVQFAHRGGLGRCRKAAELDRLPGNWAVFGPCCHRVHRRPATVRFPNRKIPPHQGWRNAGWGLCPGFLCHRPLASGAPPQLRCGARNLVGLLPV